MPLISVTSKEKKNNSQKKENQKGKIKYYNFLICLFQLSKKINQFKNKFV